METFFLVSNLLLFPTFYFSPWPKLPNKQSQMSKDGEGKFQGVNGSQVESPDVQTAAVMTSEPLEIPCYRKKTH